MTWVDHACRSPTDQYFTPPFATPLACKNRDFNHHRAIRRRFGDARQSVLPAAPIPPLIPGAFDERVQTTKWSEGI